MNEIIKEIENAQLKESVPAFEVGDTVRVHNRIQEGNKSRIQIFEGTVIKISRFSKEQLLRFRAVQTVRHLRFVRFPTAVVLRRLGPFIPLTLQT